MEQNDIRGEAKRILEHYLFHSDNNFVFSISPFGVGPEKRKAILREWHSFERPDIYSNYNGKIYGLEHFEYDAHGRGKKGSLQRRENVKIKQSVEEEIKEKFKDHDSVTSFRELKSKANEEDYKANFVGSFKAHYSKIDEYKDHLSKTFDIDSKDIPIWFIAEDMTMLGSYFVCRNKPKQGAEPAFPLFFPEIEELFLKSKKLEGIIFADNCNKVLTIVKRNKKAVEMLKKHHHYFGESLFFFEPRIASTAIKIFSVKE